MFELIFAFSLDLLIGDPVYPYHPVRLMGRLIEAAERFLRSKIRGLKLAGALLAFSLPVFVFLLGFAVVRGLALIHPVLGMAANLFGIYSALAIRDLHQEGKRLFRYMRKADLEKARRQLARIVGRDTEKLGEKEISRAGVETIAESTLDGIVSPLFYAALGGAPLALAYKAVNTLDSMIGHRNERYREFGFWAAKLDEVWNWLPARISYFLIAFGAFFVTGRIREALFTGWQDGMSAPYGNGAIPEATFAGAMGLRLGGSSTYEGRLVKKPFLGFPLREFEKQDISTALRLMTASAWISLAFALFLHYAIHVCVQFIF